MTLFSVTDLTEQKVAGIEPNRADACPVLLRGTSIRDSSKKRKEQ
jgi:hypothetical protein